MKKTLFMLYVPLLVAMLAMGFGPAWLGHAIFIAFLICFFVWMAVGVVIVAIVGVRDIRQGRVTISDLAVGILFGWIAAPLKMRSLLRKKQAP